MTTEQLPERIRLSRARGWRKPANAVVVSRPSRWGNPFRVGTQDEKLAVPGVGVLTAAQAVELFECHISVLGSYEYDDDTLAALRQLAGRPFACWCPLTDEHGERYPCHADVLLAIANDGRG